MAAIARRPRALPAALAVSLIAAACSLVNPVEGPTDKQQNAARLVREGKHAEAASAYASLAIQLPADSDNYELLSAEQWAAAGNVAAAKRSWATTHVEEVVGFIRAYVSAIDWLYDAANRDEAVRILTRHLPRMPSALAQRSYDLLLDREEGFFRRGKIDLDGLETVLQLRSRHAEPKAVLTDPARYYDPTYHGMAMRR